jgi:hypothetical protein
MRIFPMMVGEYLISNEISHRPFLNYLQICEITRDLYDDSFSKEKIILLRENINNYLIDFKGLYEKKLTPKQHFLIHYPTAIERWGPPRLYSTMRFESKHSYFKRVINAIHNAINISHSLALRHQNLQVHHLLSTDYFANLGLGSHDFSAEKPLLDFIKLRLKANNIELYKWIKNKGIKYHTNDFVVSSKNEMPIFSLIKAIIFHRLSIFFLLDEYETMGYNVNLTCYMIKETERELKICTINKLVNLWPLGGYPYGQLVLISPKYPLV